MLFREIRLCLLLSLLLCVGAQRGCAQSALEGVVEWRLGVSVRLDSLGSDYDFTGSYRTGLGFAPRHQASYAVAGGEHWQLEEVRYRPVGGMVVGGLPGWLARGEAGGVTVERGLEGLRVSVDLPAFRWGANGVESLASYRLVLENGGGAVRGGSLRQGPVSLLASGRWVRIRVSKSGVYALRASDLRAQGFDEPSRVSVWGVPGGGLEYANPAQVPRLHQIPLQWFDSETACAYLEGPDVWRYDATREQYMHRQSDYDQAHFYLLTDSRPPLGVKASALAGALAGRHESYWGVSSYIGSNDPLCKAGRERFGVSFAGNSSHRISSGLPASAGGAQVRVVARLAARSMSPTPFQVTMPDGTLRQVSTAGIPVGAQSITKAEVVEWKERVSMGASESAWVNISTSNSSPSAEAWIASVHFNAQVPLLWGGEALYPRFSPLSATPGVAELSIQNMGGDVVVWDVSDIYNVRALSTRPLLVPADQHSTLALFQPSALPSPAYEGEVPNQDLGSMEVPEMVIVCLPQYASLSESLAGIYRASGLTNMRVTVVDVERIYNEYAGGTPDGVAIRNFIRDLYERGGGAGGRLRHVLLVGKADYRLRHSGQGRAMLPNYQTENSYDYSKAYGTDDFYGLLDAGEGGDAGGMDVGVGRYPVESVSDMEAILAHERAYHRPENWGEWLGRVILLADDEDGNTYMEGSESLAQHIEQTHPEVSVSRLYADGFKQRHAWYKQQYPSLKAALNAQVGRGAAILNFMGHGSEIWLMHEGILSWSAVQQWRNLSRLPIVVAASCNLAINDQPGFNSFLVDALKLPSGGVSALIAASQYSFASSNYAFNSHLIQALYPAPPKEALRSLGTALAVGKNNTPGIENKRKYALIGNPALPILAGRTGVTLSTFNGNPPQGEKDVMQALGEYTLTFAVDNVGGAPFEGKLYLEVQGGEESRQSLSNDGTPRFSFKERTQTLYRGEAEVKDGKAEFRIVPPRDADGPIKKGRMALLAASPKGVLLGSVTDFSVGGRSSREVNDSEGPRVQLFLNDWTPRAKYIVGRNPVLLARLEDASGVKPTGGVSLTLLKEGATVENGVPVGEFYRASSGDSRSGTLEYQLADLAPGRYQLRLRALDLVDNSGEAEIPFEVMDESKPGISGLLNYPNPMTAGTSFYFDLSYTGQPARIQIQIFTVDGRLARVLSHIPSTPGGRIGPIYWDGLDRWGRRVGRGVYFYRVHVIYDALGASEERESEAFEKLVVI